MKKYIWILWLGLISLASPLLHAEESLLPPDEAYAFTARMLDANTIEAGWQVADGYYLYGNKIRFSSDTPGIRLGKPDLPKGKIKQDEFFGELEVYRHEVMAKIPLIREKDGITEFVLVARSQGCADIGVCYPPHVQKITLTLPAAAAQKPSLPTLQSLGGFADGLGLGGGGDDGILDPDVAFEFSTELADSNTIIARWNIAPDHYLYRDKIKFSLKQGDKLRLDQVQLPAGELKHDEFFGQIMVFHDRIEARIPLLRETKAATDIVLHVEYQGCAEKLGICYPPIKKDLNFALPITSQLVGSAIASTHSSPDASQADSRNEAISDVDQFARDLSEGSLFTVIVTALGFGLMLAFTACMYPMIPILSSIIVGHGDKISASKGFGLSLIYVMAMALTFGLIGAITASVGEGAGIQAHFQSPWVLVPFALLFVALSFAMFGFYNIQIPSFIQSKLNMVSNQQKGGSLTGVAIMGVLSALIIGPCGGPILIAALSYAATSADMLNGFVALFMLGFGMGLPLLVVGASGGKLLPKAGNWMNTVKAVSGVVLLAIAILMLERMPTLFSPMLTMTLWATLFIVSAIYMRALEPIPVDGSGWRTLWKGFGVTLLLYGAIVLLGGLTGAKDVTHPFHGSKLIAGGVSIQGAANTGTTAPHLQFTRIKTVADLEQQLANAAAQGKPVMFDFYADWCTYCKEYEEYVFPDPAVQAALKNFVLLQADVTAMDDEDKALMKRARVILPPAILFFGTDSQEQRSQRVVGSMNAATFLAHVKKISASQS